MTERIKLLEKEALKLEPSYEDRNGYLEKVIKYSQDFLEDLPGLKTYCVTEDNGAGLYDSPIEEEPIDMDEILRLIKDNVDTPGINPASGGHLGYIPGGGIFPAALGDYLSDVTNRYAGIFFASPGAVRMENMLIRWLCDMIGFPTDTSGGNLTSGGSMANLIAIVTVRDSLTISAGDYNKLVIYCTRHIHHSANKAMKIAGLSEAVFRYIPMDENFRMDAGYLEKEIGSDKNKGMIPFIVYASAGTTDTGAVDPVSEIGDITEKYNVWLHVDAAYGGFFLLCDEGKKIIKGLEKADSVIVDPHKGLFLPYGSGAILIKDRDKLYNSQNYLTKAHYLQDVVDIMDEYSPADMSPELTRNVRGMRMWLPLKLFGLKPFRAALEEKILLARYFYEKIMEIEGMETGPYPELSTVIFRYIPKNEDPAVFNQKLLQEIYKDGRIFFTSTIINETLYLRITVLSFRTHLDTVNLALDIIKECICKLTGNIEN